MTLVSKAVILSVHDMVLILVARIFNTLLRGDRLDFHGCANRYAIENVDGNIYDNMGFVGSWYCDSAIATAANIALTVTAGMMFVV